MLHRADILLPELKNEFRPHLYFKGKQTGLAVDSYCHSGLEDSVFHYVLDSRIV